MSFLQAHSSNRLCLDTERPEGRSNGFQEAAEQDREWLKAAEGPVAQRLPERKGDANKAGLGGVGRHFLVEESINMEGMAFHMRQVGRKALGSPCERLW